MAHLNAFKCSQFGGSVKDVNKFYTLFKINFYFCINTQIGQGFIFILPKDWMCFVLKASNFVKNRSFTVKVTKKTCTVLQSAKLMIKE